MPRNAPDPRATLTSAGTPPRLPAKSFRRQLAETVILVLGCPRSGTTWLAKIFDSHPDVLYRHEPDELLLPRAGALPVDQIVAWLDVRGLRAAGKRPLFRKSWRSGLRSAARRAMAAALAGAERSPAAPFVARHFGLPDLIVRRRRGAVRAAIKLVNWDGSEAARTLPDCRCCLILRHPCGQIASAKKGMDSSQFHFAKDSDGPVDVATSAAFARGFGVSAEAFAALPDAAKFAWAWRAFNEPAVDGLRALPNAKIVIYEDLCAEPEAVARDLFTFAELEWNEQTAAFIAQSTGSKRESGYYDVFRTTSEVVDRWRQTMSADDQAAVRAVVAGSPLAHYWPDLTVTAGLSLDS